MKIYPDAANLFCDAGVARTQASKESYRHTLRHLQSCYPKLRLDQFTTAVLTEYCMAGDPSPNTARTRRGRLGSFFAWAKFAGLVTDNPAEGLRFSVRPAGGGVRQHQWLNEQQVAELVKSVDGRTRIVVLLGVFLGLRRTEIAQLEWSAFTPTMDRLTTLGKGNKLATMGVPVQLRIALQDWRRQAPKDAVYVVPHLSASLHDSAPCDWSKPLSAQVINIIISKCGLRPHDLRRSYAGILDAKGVKESDIQRLMRHSNLSTTSAYLDKNPARAQQLADAFEIGGI